MSNAQLRLTEFLPYQLSITSNAVSDLIARSYRARFGLKIPEWRVMAVLGENPSMTQRGAGRSDGDGQGDGQPREQGRWLIAALSGARRMRPMAGRIILC